MAKSSLDFRRSTSIKTRPHARPTILLVTHSWIRILCQNSPRGITHSILIQSSMATHSATVNPVSTTISTRCISIPSFLTSRVTARQLHLHQRPPLTRDAGCLSLCISLSLFTTLFSCQRTLSQLINRRVDVVYLYGLSLSLLLRRPTAPASLVVSRLAVNLTPTCN